MSSEEERAKRFQKLRRNHHAKELEKYRPKVIKPVTTYKRQNLKPQDVIELIESEYDEQQTD